MFKIKFIKNYIESVSKYSLRFLSKSPKVRKHQLEKFPSLPLHYKYRS